MKARHLLIAVALMGVLALALGLVDAVASAPEGGSPCKTTRPGMEIVHGTDAAGRAFCAYFDGTRLHGPRVYVDGAPQ